MTTCKTDFTQKAANNKKYINHQSLNLNLGFQLHTKFSKFTTNSTQFSLKLKMRTPCCHTFTAFILKFLIFFQTFIGISIIIYSAYMLNQWEKHSPIIPPSPSPLPSPPPSDLSPAPSPDSSDSVFSVFRVSDQLMNFNFETNPITGLYDAIQLESNPIPAPW